MPSKRRPISLLGPLIRLDRDPNPPSPPLSTPTHLDSNRTRTQSLRSGLDEEVFVFSNSKNTTINSPRIAQINAKMTRNSTEQVPSYISSRSANSLISYSRPTRTQAVTLHYLNKILDELLLHILTSAKSLATDRIKTDGILKVLGGQSGSGSGAGALLAKNAVLEAELELRTYLDGQRKEGGKVPLGLSATSRYDGTNTFPVQKAYEALRVRCQYYSTLGDLEDPSPTTPQDQNIMSTDGRPIATITPGVAIYVTALLEFVAEYILQNVGRVIERDNSDEAGLSELKKAMEEDEGTAYWWNKMETREEVVANEKMEQSKGGKGRVGKPWKVPDASELDEAAGRKRFQRQSLSISSANTMQTARSGASTTTMAISEGRSVPSPGTHESRDSFITASQQTTNSIPTSGSTSTDPSSTSPGLTRRVSSDKGWFGKRRGSMRSSVDVGAASSAAPSTFPFKGTVTTSDVIEAEDLNNSDDFDSLMMSGQTMKVSLTPNRLRSIEVAKDRDGEGEEDGKRSMRRRPGTLFPLAFRDGDQVSRSALPSPSPTVISKFSVQQNESESVESPVQPPRSGVRSVKTASKGAPPSAYRGVAQSDPVMLDEEEVKSSDRIPSTRRARKDMSSLTGVSNFGANENKLRPRNEGLQDSSLKDMVDIFNSTPPLSNGAFSGGQDVEKSQGAASITTSENNGSIRKSALTSAGGKVRSLFGRRAPSSSGSINGAPTRNTSEDSIGKFNSPSKPTILDSIEQPRIRSREASLSKLSTGTTGLALTGVTSGVAMDAMTKGLPDSNIRTNRSSGAKSVRKEPPVEEEEPKTPQSTDISIDRFSESGLEGSTSQPSVGGTRIVNGYNNDIVSSNLVGLYEEPRANSSASELSSGNQHTNRSIASRKIPWNYSRQSSGASRRLSGNSGPTGIARVGSGGSYSLGHGSTGDFAPPSAWQGQGETGSVTESRTPTLSGLTTFASGSPRSPVPSNGRSLDTARVLAHLNQKMKVASSVEECRFLITQAMASAAAAVRNDVEQPQSAGMVRASSALSSTMPYFRRDSGSFSGDVGDEDASSADRREVKSKVSPSTAPPVPAKDAMRSIGLSPSPQINVESVGGQQLSTQVKHRNMMLPMAVGYNLNEDLDAPSHKRQGIFAAWLLDGEEVGEDSNQIDSLSPGQPSIAISRESNPSPEQSVEEQERYSSADDRMLDP